MLPTTVKRTLQEEGIPDAPSRRDSTWREFIDRHADTLWACDFGAQVVLSLTGIRVVYFLFFIRVGSRRVYYAGSTEHPDSAWVAQQARNFSMHLQERNETAKYLIHDRDKKFTKQFDSILLSENLELSGESRTISQPSRNALTGRDLGRTVCASTFRMLGAKWRSSPLQFRVGLGNRQGKSVLGPDSNVNAVGITERVSRGVDGAKYSATA